VLLAAALLSTLVGCASRRRLTITSVTISAGSSSVLVGSNTPAFTATGHVDDGSTVDLTSTVTWTSSDPTKATINNSGVATGVFHGTTTITATCAGVTSTPVALTVIALVKSLTLSPIGPSVAVGGNQQFTATATLNDGSIGDVTVTSADPTIATVTNWASSDPTKATISASGTATGVTAGAVTITCTVTSADGSVVTAITALNIVTTIYPPLHGRYAFTLFSADTRGPQFFFGSFFADGKGNLTDGVEDGNTASGVAFDSLTGTYNEYPDGRGNITFHVNAIHPGGITLRFILAANGGIGKLMEFDGQGTARGSFEPQDSAAFDVTAINGNYVFRSGGSDAASLPIGEVGVFAANGEGGITGGNIDINDNGTLSDPAEPLTTTAYTVDATTGRGTLQLATASGTANYAFYVIDSGKVNLIQIDAAPSTALAGVAEMQSTQVFSASSVEGGYTFLLDGPAVVGSGGNPDLAEFNKVGFWNFDGEGTLVSGQEDVDHAIHITGLTGEYVVSSPINGRGVVQDTTPSMLTRTYVFYMASPSKLYVLESFKDSKVAPIGVAEQQSDQPYSQATLSGSYALDASELTETYSEILMQLVFDGKGGVGGIADWSCKGAISACPNGPVSSTVVAPVYNPINPNPDPVAGRGVLGIPNSVGANAYIFYLRNSDRAWILGASPDSDGQLTKQ
jgi:Big-like domain-containing protein